MPPPAANCNPCPTRPGRCDRCSSLPTTARLLPAATTRRSRFTTSPATGAFPVHAGGAVAVALHPEPPQAITAGADKTVKLWDLATGKEVKTIATLRRRRSPSLAASRDFTGVAVTAGKIAKVFQLSDSKELASIDAPGRTSSR